MGLNTNREKTRAWIERSRQTARDNQKPRAKIRKVSSKRRKQNAEYSHVRAAYLETSPQCARCAQNGVCEAATEIHHAGGREGARLTDTPLFVALCGPCHRWVHDNPLAARDAGLLTTKHLKTK